MTDFPRELWPTEKNWWHEHDDSPKVYRSTFSLNRTLAEETGNDGEEIYPFWSLPKFTDITHVYGRHYLEQVRIPVSRLYNTPTKGKIAYLCLSYRKKMDSGRPYCLQARTTNFQQTTQRKCNAGRYL